MKPFAATITRRFSKSRRDGYPFAVVDMMIDLVFDTRSSGRHEELWKKDKVRVGETEARKVRRSMMIHSQRTICLGTSYLPFLSHEPWRTSTKTDHLHARNDVCRRRMMNACLFSRRIFGKLIGTWGVPGCGSRAVHPHTASMAMRRLWEDYLYFIWWTVALRSDFSCTNTAWSGAREGTSRPELPPFPHRRFSHSSHHQKECRCFPRAPRTQISPTQGRQRQREQKGSGRLQIAGCSV